ncbi:hypothetical protein ACHAP5_010317 [Fusarium lateritium]
MPPPPVFHNNGLHWSPEYRKELETQGQNVLNDDHIFPDDLENPLIRACVIRAIRCDIDFAKSANVAQACTQWPEFARSRNARLIMSNELPEPEQMPESDPLTHPYCIWYPDFATEQTYRQLAQAFPWVRYQVGRACAAAGFALYSELNLLPDVCIAEEARESRTDGGRAIYDAIMAAPMRYAVMNDLKLSIELDNPRSPAFLNGDTDVRWKLDNRVDVKAMVRLGSPVSQLPEKWLPNPCIEEDIRVSKVYTLYNPEKEWQRRLTREETRLFYQPLPQDLPTVKKQSLTEMAAYEGNVDRYSRLAWPEPLGRTHLICVIRGIYHHTSFARWWSEEINTNSPRARVLNQLTLGMIRSAISARRIMINDVQEFSNGWSAGPKPFLIWWPLKPDRTTIDELAEMVPEMREQAAIACIKCGYDEKLSGIKPKPTPALWLAATQSPNPSYRKWLEDRLMDLQMNEDLIKSDRGLDTSDASALLTDKEPTTTTIHSSLSEGLHRADRSGHYESPAGPYLCEAVLVGEVDRHIWVSEENLRKIEKYARGVTENLASLEDKGL